MSLHMKSQVELHDLLIRLTNEGQLTWRRGKDTALVNSVCIAKYKSNNLTLYHQSPLSDIVSTDYLCLKVNNIVLYGLWIEELGKAIDAQLEKARVSKEAEEEAEKYKKVLRALKK